MAMSHTRCPLLLDLGPFLMAVLGGLNTKFVACQAAFGGSWQSVLSVAGSGSFSTATVYRWIVSPNAL